MKINEKLQYKARNYLYGMEQAKKNKPFENEDKSQSKTNNLWNTLDEMDKYLGEKISGYKQDKKTHTK